MRLFRWLLPPAIVAIAVAVAWVYLDRLQTLADNAPARPAPLAPDIKQQSLDSCITQSIGDKPRFRACFEKSEQLDKRLQLYGVRMEVYKPDASFDLIEYKTALFDQESKKLYSDGEVEITLGVPPDAPPSGRLLRIHAKGVEFDNETLRIFTDKDVRFDFEQGGGTAVGAYYDPTTRELRMNSQVVLDWHGKTADAVPMHVEAGQAWYFEAESKVLLFPWAKMKRATLNLDGGPSEMYLKDGEIERADMQGARGIQADAKRTVEFAAERIHMDFADKMQVRKVEAEKDAHLVSTSATARTTVSGARLDLAFVPGEDSSALTSAVATGQSRVEVAPVPRAGQKALGNDAPDTRVLKSDVIRLAMRESGEEIEHLETDGPGTLDFLPNRPNQPKRNLEGDRIWIDYAAENKIRQFRSINAKTRTERPSRPPMLTSSQEILAFFDPTTTELTRLEQNRAFKYEEGDRRASANRAVLEQTANRITLDGAARSADPSGSVNADKIVLDQRTNDFVADGRVTTVREPKPRANGMLSSKEVLQASANRMTSTDNGQKIHYEGNAQAWQGADRVQADVLDIDQQTGIMKARGKVVTQISEDPKPGKGTKPIFTKVSASTLTYTESTHEALYEGGVALERPALTVDSQTLRAFLTQDSSLEKAYADGTVKIVSTELSTTKQKRIRTGTSEHAEYFTADERVRLSGGRARITDTAKDLDSVGDELIWWTRDDRVQQSGSTEQPTRTTFKKK